MNLWHNMSDNYSNAENRRWLNLNKLELNGYVRLGLEHEE